MNLCVIIGSVDWCHWLIIDFKRLENTVAVVERFECCGFLNYRRYLCGLGGGGPGVERVIHQEVCGSSPAAPVPLGRSLDHRSWAVCAKCSAEPCCVDAARTVKCLWVVVRSRKALCRHRPFRTHCLFFSSYWRAVKVSSAFSFSTFWGSRLASAPTDLRWNLISATFPMETITD